MAARTRLSSPQRRCLGNSTAVASFRPTDCRIDADPGDIALRVLTLLEFVARRELSQQVEPLRDSMPVIRNGRRRTPPLNACCRLLPTSPKLDFVHLCGESERVGKAVEKRLGNLYDIGVIGRHPNNGDGPKVLTNKGQSIGKRRDLLCVPSSLTC